MHYPSWIRGYLREGPTVTSADLPVSSAARWQADAADSEAQLVARAQADPAAFGRLYDAHYSRILSYLFRRTLDPHLAEELTSNVFYKALRALPKYRHRASFAAWLYRIATNELRMHWRRTGARPSIQGDPDWDELAARVRFDTDGPEGELERREQLAEYAQASRIIAALPDRYQTVLSLRYFEGLSLAEVAQATGKRVGTVKSLIHRGLKRVRKLQAAEGATRTPG
jgi:RNA polymerase sigma-70 factor (ECF subfamily)